MQAQTRTYRFLEASGVNQLLVVRRKPLPGILGIECCDIQKYRTFDVLSHQTRVGLPPIRNADD